jgi:hypothetical protein
MNRVKHKIVLVWHVQSLVAADVGFGEASWVEARSETSPQESSVSKKDVAASATLRVHDFLHAGLPILNDSIREKWLDL